MKRWLCLVLAGILLLGCAACMASEDPTGAPHKNVSAKDLTDEQAQEILSFLMPKYGKIFATFNEVPQGGVDETQPYPLDGEYFLLTDERFSYTCVQDVKDFILSVLTEEAAEQNYFQKYLNDDPAASLKPYYVDYDGKLYRYFMGGKGQNTRYLTETSRIVERGEDWVKIEMNTLYVLRESSWLYTPTLVRTKNGWRINSSLWDGYDPETQ